MIRKLLATTAVAAILVVPAVAQDASSSMMDSQMSSMDSSMMSSQPTDDASMMSSAPMDSSMTSSAPMDMSSQPMSSYQPRTPVDIISGYTRVDSDRLATKILGAAVYDSGAADANNLGTINDLVLNQNGEVAAVVLGVGGFLGLGQKQVAVDFQALQWIVADDHTERFVLQTTVDELTQAPDFQTVDDNPADGSSMMDDTMSSAPMAPAGNDAMATSSAAQ